MGMTVILGMNVAMKMHMAPAVMIMAMKMPPFPNQFHAEQTAEDDEHESHESLGRDRKRFGNGHSEDEHDRADNEQHNRMTDAPAQTDQTRGTPRGPLGEHSRNGCKVVRIQRVT